MKRIILILFIVTSSISSIAQSPMGLLGCDLNKTAHELKMYLLKEKGFEFDFNREHYNLYEDLMNNIIIGRIAMFHELAGYNDVSEDDIFVSGLEFNLLNGSFDNTLDCSIAMQSFKDKIVMIIVRCYVETDRDKRAFQKISNLYKHKYGENAVREQLYLNEYNGAQWEILITENTMMYLNYDEAVNALQGYEFNTLMI